MSDETAVINVSAIGEETKTQYRGAFTVRTLLTRRQIAAADSIRRAIIGQDPDSAFQTIKEDAFMAGRLAVAITSAPDWYKSMGEGGIDCPDRALILELHSKWQVAVEDRRKKLESTADSAREELLNKKE